MAEVFMVFDTPVRDEFGTYHARVVGRQAADGMWEGWLEFVPTDGETDVLIGPVESRQPERHDLVYWSTGFAPVFLEGALQRARNPVTVRTRTVEVPLSHLPAQKTFTTTRVVPPGPEPVLDPFEIGTRSLDVLKQELGALNRPRLLNIISGFDLARNADLTQMTDAELIGFIVAAVETHLSRAR